MSEFKCNPNDCMYYTVIKKGGKYKGFCDIYSQFFSEMPPNVLLEREEFCTEQKPKPTSTKI